MTQQGTDTHSELQGLALQTRVELRRLLDTRFGVALVAVALIGSIGTAVAMAVLEQEYSAQLTMFCSTIVPVAVMSFVGLRSTASEWDERYGAHTFMFNPRRGEVLIAKLWAVVIVSVVLWGVCLFVSLVCSYLAGAPGGEGFLRVAGGCLVAMVLLCLQGASLGTLLMGMRSGLVALVVLTAAAIGIGHIDQQFLRWVSLPHQVAGLVKGDFGPFGQLVVSSSLWIALPLGLGARRWMRRDILQ